MVHHGGEDCAKGDAWEAQKERNERYDRMFDKIEKHLGEQTAIMRDIARQSEQIVTLQREQKDNRKLIDRLFDLDREHKKETLAFQQQVTERFHRHEMEPIKEKVQEGKEKDKETRVERLRFSTGAWLILIGAVLNQILGWLKGLAKMGATP